MQQYLEVVRGGQANGNGMLLSFRFPSGLVVHGLPTPNEYGGEWDLGPTWNYLVMGDRPCMVDVGRWGQGGALVRMMGEVGCAPRDLEFVLLSHGHEDHDGGLAELEALTGAKVKAHAAYGLLARTYPELAPTEYKRTFPAKCWHCFMPASHYETNCLPYHGELGVRQVEDIASGHQALGTDLETIHTPGHCPDALALVLGNEAVVVGDNILPGITPWPTSLGMYRLTATVLSGICSQAGELYGLERYLRSLKDLAALGRAHPDMVVLPAHRLFYGGHLHAMDLVERVEELMEHHRQRCGDILRILGSGPQDAETLARAHFEQNKLAGPGLMMAKNEIICHCELLMAAGDAVRTPEKLYAATGASTFERYMESI